MRVGIFGGTFDPVHYGHLILAEQCREQAELDRVLFIPAPRPPHKNADALSRFDQRVEMLQLAIAGQPAFQIDEIEKDRAGPSYTVDTLDELRRCRPGDELFLMIGSDTLKDLPNWREPGRVLQLADLLVMQRPDNPSLNQEQLRSAVGMAPSEPCRMRTIEAPLIDISSRDLRRRAAAGRSLRFFLPRAVEVYILDRRLYRAG